MFISAVMRPVISGAIRESRLDYKGVICGVIRGIGAGLLGRL